MIDTVTDFVAESLFASPLQPSQQPEPAQAWAAVTETLTRLGVDGCGAALAAAYGEAMETAAARMRWCRALAAALTADRAAA